MTIRENVLLAPYTTFHIGGPARFFAEVKTDKDLTLAVTFAHDHNLPIFVLGGGSNLLVADEGFSGLVIYMKNEIVEWKEEGGEMLAVADAGVSWDRLVAMCVERELWGLENLSGIPGSVGASVVQNIGAYGAEVGSRIAWVDIYEKDSQTFKRLSREDCKLAYRESIFKHPEGSQYIVLRVAYMLSRTGVPDINYKDITEYAAKEKPVRTLHDVRSAVLTIRSRKFPNYPEHPNIGTAGSFFKNPVVSGEEARVFIARYPEAPAYPQKDGNLKLSAAWIIDHVLHMKGVREGEVGTWSAQALVMINYGDASAHDVAAFASGIIKRAYNETNIQLEPEVVYVGEIKV